MIRGRSAYYSFEAKGAIASGCYPVAYTSVIPVHRLDNAINYALDEKRCSRRANEESLESALHKALNEDKSEQDLFASACGCTCETAFEDMCRVKAMWHKEKGVQGFHLVQSFAAGEAAPELAHQIGLEFADRLLHGNFQAVIITHLNTKYIHNHIVWNSVSVKDGKKYLSTEQKDVKMAILDLQELIDSSEQEQHDLQQFLKNVCKYTDPEELTAEILNDLVDKIVVHAPDKSSSHRKQKIEIYYKAAGIINIADKDCVTLDGRQERWHKKTA